MMIPSAFLDRMRGILKEDFDSFCNALVEENTVHAVRYNPEKIEKKDVFWYNNINK